AFVIVKPKSVQGFKIGSTPEISLAITNIGNTPAYQVKLRTSAAIVVQPLPADFNFPYTRLAHQPEGLVYRGDDLTSSVRMSVPLGREQLDDLSPRGSRRLYAWGELTYLTFEKPKFYRFCFFYDSEDVVRNSPQVCEQYNGAD